MHASLYASCVTSDVIALCSIWNITDTYTHTETHSQSWIRFVVRRSRVRILCGLLRCGYIAVVPKRHGGVQNCLWPRAHKISFGIYQKDKWIVSRLRFLSVAVSDKTMLILHSSHHTSIHIHIYNTQRHNLNHITHANTCRIHITPKGPNVHVHVCRAYERRA